MRKKNRRKSYTDAEVEATVKAPQAKKVLLRKRRGDTQEPERRSVGIMDNDRLIQRSIANRKRKPPVRLSAHACLQKGKNINFCFVGRASWIMEKGGSGAIFQYADVGLCKWMAMMGDNDGCRKHKWNLTASLCWYPEYRKPIIHPEPDHANMSRNHPEGEE